MSDAKIKDYMTKDPNAQNFMRNMLPGAVAEGTGTIANGNNSKENSLERVQNGQNQRSGAQIRMRNVKVNQMRKYEEKYRWPYYDSYAPNVAMHKPDE